MLATVAPRSATITHGYLIISSFVHSTSQTELTCNKSTQIHDIFTSHERQHHDLIG